MYLHLIVVNAPVEAEFAPIAAPSIAPPSISIELSVPKEVTLGCAAVCRVPVRLPLKLVAEIVPVEGLYVASPSDSKLIVPPSKSASAAKINALPSLVFSLSVTVTVLELVLGVDQESAPLPSVFNT